MMLGNIFDFNNFKIYNNNNRCSFCFRETKKYCRRTDENLSCAMRRKSVVKKLEVI